MMPAAAGFMGGRQVQYVAMTVFSKVMVVGVEGIKRAVLGAAVMVLSAAATCATRKREDLGRDDGGVGHHRWQKNG